jgi:PPOX class probable F420-dependent enzyme
MSNDPRLLTEKNIWLATVRPDGRPHLVPIWFVWIDEKVYICTQESVKVKNLRANPRASVALENGTQPAIAEGTARFVERPFPPRVVQAFAEKYEWTIERDGQPPAEDNTYNVLIEITPAKWLKW